MHPYLFRVVDEIRQQLVIEIRENPFYGPSGGKRGEVIITNQERL